MNNRELRLHIRALGEGRKLPKDTELGLCYEYAYAIPTTSSQERIIHQFLCSWPNRDIDNRDYLVPHPTLDSASAFMRVKNLWEPNKQLCKEDREYINNRLSLCRWIARQLYKLPEWK